ncbi:MAG: hypothetical protein M3281_09690 [Chloroflexota bacterium]|nr:hypothetical protein [Chloroflexota bacterium]
MSRLNLVSLLFGAAFGFLFAAAGFNQYDVVHGTLLLHYLDPFFVMGSAVATAMPLLWLLERRGQHTPLGGALALRRWPVERKHVYGGVVFGTGWAVTGACPGTASTMLAAGSLLGLVLLGGILVGIVLRDIVVERQATVPVEPSTVPNAATDVA